MQERASPCAVWLTGGDRLCLGFFFFLPPLWFWFWFWVVSFCFVSFVLIKDSSGLCPVCTVCYRHHPAGTLVLLESLAPTPNSSLIPADLAWQRQEVQKKGQYCSRRVRAQSRGGRAAYGDFQLLHQNSKRECFCLSCTRPGLFPQP